MSDDAKDLAAQLGQRLTAEVLDPMKRAFVGKDEIIDLMGVSLIGRENLFILGPPGTAKSALVNDLGRRLEGRVFDYLLTRFTEPNELFGPFDIRRLREGDLGLFLASVSRDGDFRLERVAAHSRQLVRAARFDLAKLLEARKRPTTGLVDQTGTHTVPLILSVTPFPIRLPLGPAVQRLRCISRNRTQTSTWASSDFAIGVMHNCTF